MYWFILFTSTNKSNKFPTRTKYNDILQGNNDGEKTSHEKWYQNETTNDISLTYPLKCWFKFLEETSYRCIMVSRL